MRIAMITSGRLPCIDGVTVTVRERCRRLAAQGHEILLIGPDYAPAFRHYPDWAAYLGAFEPGVTGVSVPSCATLGMDWERQPLPRAYREMTQYLEAFAPDIVHVDEPERLAFGFLRRPGIAYARRRGIRVVASYHTNFIDYIPDFLGTLPRWAVGLAQWLAPSILSAIYNAYDTTLTATARTQARLARYGVRNTVLSRFCGVDTAVFRPMDRSATYFADRFRLDDVDGRTKILLVGRLTPDKGWAFACRAIAALVQATGPGKLAVLVAGGGELAEMIRRELGAVLDQAHLLGRVPPDDMPLLYAHADIHVSASCKETFGLTGLEAAACGIPVVAPRAGGFLDHVDCGRSGYLYAPDDIQDFLRVMLPLIESRHLRSQLGEGGRHAALGMDWTESVADWLRAVVGARDSPLTRDVPNPIK
jgi:glycosyltransferase involved in cell wall biosynthesis